MMLKEFKEFAMRGNVVDLAVGVIIGGAFGQITNSLVKDVIMPPLGLLTGKVDFTNKFIVIGTGKSFPTLDAARGAATSLAEAVRQGIPTFNYGNFINSLINFLIVAFAIFLVVRWINRLSKPVNAPDAAPSVKDCPLCYSKIDPRATRCPQCAGDIG